MKLPVNLKYALHTTASLTLCEWPPAIILRRSSGRQARKISASTLFNDLFSLLVHVDKAVVVS